MNFAYYALETSSNLEHKIKSVLTNFTVFLQSELMAPSSKEQRFVEPGTANCEANAMSWTLRNLAEDRRKFLSSLKAHQNFHLSISFSLT